MPPGPPVGRPHDSQEGVVKLDHSGDVKMLQLKYLCKMKSDD